MNILMFVTFTKEWLDWCISPPPPKPLRLVCLCMRSWDFEPKAFSLESDDREEGNVCDAFRLQSLWVFSAVLIFAFWVQFQNSLLSFASQFDFFSHSP